MFKLCTVSGKKKSVYNTTHLNKTVTSFLDDVFDQNIKNADKDSSLVFNGNKWTYKRFEKGKDLPLHETKELIKTMVDDIFKEKTQGKLGLFGEKGLLGDKGPMGDKGVRGEHGVRGETGLKGENGEKGSVGDRGLQGFQGPNGDKGARGEKGLSGDTGVQGPNGIQGDTGLQGPNGEKVQ